MSISINQSKNNNNFHPSKTGGKKKSKKEKQLMPVYLPDNLDLQKLLKENPPMFNHRPSKFNDLVDNFKYLINLITQIPLHNRDVIKDTGFVPCDSKEMEKWVHHHSPYLEYLIQHEVLETDGHYIVGQEGVKGESMGYRFTVQYETNLKRDTISKTSIIKRYHQQREQQNKDRDRYPYLAKWFNSDLNIDLQGAYDFLDEQFAEDVRLGDPKAWGRYTCGKLAAEKIARGEWSFSIDPTAGRLNTNLTNLPKALRNFITYAGQKLCSIDIKNSQPCFSGLLFDPEFYKKWEAEGEKPWEKLNFEDFGHFSWGRYDEAIIQGRSSLMFVNLEGGGQVIQKYREKIQAGNLYEFMQDKIFKTTGRVLDRDAIKIIVLTALYSRNRFFGGAGDDYKRLFKKLFPAIYEVFKAIKSPAHNILAVLLQAIEAKVMLAHVARRIHLERPDMPIFTIHDSIVCPVGNEAYVATVIKEEMKKLTGMCPTVKPEYWSPEEMKPKTITLKSQLMEAA